MTEKAIQDHYPPEFGHCYGCGAGNQHGLQLKSYLIGDNTVARFTPDSKYSGGVPDHLYGGMIASLLDCHGTASAAAFRYQKSGRQMGDRFAPVRFVTASLKIDFIRPTPLGCELLLTGTLRSMDGRKALVNLTLVADGQVCANAEMLAISLADSNAAKDGSGHP